MLVIWAGSVEYAHMFPGKAVFVVAGYVCPPHTQYCAATRLSGSCPKNWQPGTTPVITGPGTGALDPVMYVYPN